MRPLTFSLPDPVYLQFGTSLSSHSSFLYCLNVYRCVCVFVCVCAWMALWPPAVNPTVSDSQATNGFHADWLLHTHTHRLIHTYTNWEHLHMNLMEKVQRFIFHCPLPLQVKGQVQENTLHGKHNCKRSQVLFLSLKQHEIQMLSYTVNYFYSYTILCTDTLSFVSKRFAKNDTHIHTFELHFNALYVRLVHPIYTVTQNK